MPANTTSLDGGFSEPVFRAQATFRTLMDAMARPATVVASEPGVQPPAPLGRAAGAIACALIDADTPFWLDAALAASGALPAWITFHTGATRTARSRDAMFALIGGASAMPTFDDFAQGTQEYPDRSATLIVEVEALDGGRPLAFEGPGVRTRATIAPRGLPGNFAGRWAANHGRFPRGVDLILTAGDMIACLPRSARLVPVEG